MKGLSLAITAVVILIIAVLVLGTVIYFLFFQASSSMTQAEANRIFYSKCGEYKTSNCEWAVTYDKEFPKFVEACRLLFGPQRDSFSCLYSFCQDCKEINLADIKCTGMCRICQGHDYASIKLNECCKNYQSVCGIGCDVCFQQQI
jgi:hypothetical protein